MAAPFATPDDVAVRWRPLNADEVSTAYALSLDASMLIRARFPGIDDQVTAGTVDPDVLTTVVAGMVKRAMVAPADGITQESEGLGPYSRGRSYANPLGNVFLTKADLTLILGYRPAARTIGYANTTDRDEQCGPGYVYGPLV